MDEDGVTSHWNVARVGLVWGIGEPISTSNTVENLEVVAVEMEGMGLEIMVEDGDFDNSVEREDDGLGIRSVDSWIFDQIRRSSAEGVQARNLEWLVKS